MTIDDPTFSVVVNTNDRAGSLRTLLRALEHQSYSRFEVIVVVGPTRDSTLEMLSEYEGRLRVLHCPQANLGQSRNIGLRASRGELVAFIDDDAVPSRCWLERLARLFRDESLDATGGVVYLIHPDYPVVQHRIGIISSLAEQVDVRSSWLEHVVPPGQGQLWVARMMGTNMAFRRRALLEVGGFDEFYEWVFDDSDIALRLAQDGKNIRPVSETVVYHVPASSRRRVAFSFNLKWWIQTKSAIYMSIKSGPVAGDSARSIALRCWRIFVEHWTWSRHLLREKQLTFLQFVRMRIAESLSALDGAVRALFSARKLIDDGCKHTQTDNPSELLRFQNRDSNRQGAVDPVTGSRPVVSLPDSPLRVCLLTSTYPPEQYEGVGRHTHLLARGLFELGHTVHVITRGEEGQTCFYDGAYVHRITYPLDRYHRYQRFPRLYHCLNHSHAIHEKVKQLMFNDGIQLVDTPLWQTNGLVTAVSALLPVVVRLQTAVRQIADIQQDRDEDTHLIEELEEALLQRAAHLIPNSRSTIRTVAQLYGVQPTDTQYTVIPHGIVPVPDGEVRPVKPKSDADSLSVLYVGRLEKRKGILDLFEAIPLVLAQSPNVRFLIAGGDNSVHDGFQRQTGMDYPTFFARRYRRVASNVEFLGTVAEETLQALYQSCDLFVAPSLYESFGLIYLEAMNYAKPVIGCRSGGVPEVIDHGVTGLLAEPEAPAALAEAMLTLLQSRTKMREMGMAGRQRLLERFTHLQMARSFAQVYRQVIQACDAEA
jgi:glycosyltransferase involved in cell wall biosynthesis